MCSIIFSFIDSVKVFAFHSTLMAFNTSDTRQRAHQPIDTSNPHGTWIEEKSYNKTRPGASKRVLCGNWQEEGSLESDMLSQGLTVGSVRQDGARFRGGFESTPYLTTAVDPRERRPDLMTTQRVSFSETNGDVRSQQQPSLGVRSAARSEQVLQQAKETLAQSQMDRTTGSLADNMKGGSLKLATKIGSGRVDKRVVNVIRQDYLHDVPITIYTGNSKTGATMVIPGKSAASAAASSVHSRHTGFTNEKYSIGTL
jgi:hypothetical protein